MAAMIFYVPFFYRKTGTHALQTPVAHHLRIANKARDQSVSGLSFHANLTHHDRFRSLFFNLLVFIIFKLFRQLIKTCAIIKSRACFKDGHTRARGRTESRQLASFELQIRPSLVKFTRGTFTHIYKCERQRKKESETLSGN